MRVLCTYYTYPRNMRNAAWVWKQDPKLMTQSGLRCALHYRLINGKLPYQFRLPACLDSDNGSSTSIWSLVLGWGWVVAKRSFGKARDGRYLLHKARVCSSSVPVRTLQTNSVAHVTVSRLKVIRCHIRRDMEACQLLHRPSPALLLPWRS